MKRGDKSKGVREPIQIYMAQDERRLLDHLAEQTGLSRAEILRQGLRSFAAERAGSDSPMQLFMRSMQARPFPPGAEDHDGHLAQAYKDTHDP